jgi:hypothetical protein
MKLLQPIVAAPTYLRIIPLPWEGWERGWTTQTDSGKVITIMGQSDGDLLGANMNSTLLLCRG